MSSVHAIQGAVVKRRRISRQRSNNLSWTLQRAACVFAREVGPPRNIYQSGFPLGHRDYAGWLRHLASVDVQESWGRLRSAVSLECGGDTHKLEQMKTGIVREIIRNLISPRRRETTQIVVTAISRQCGRPKSAITLMKLLDNAMENLKMSHIVPPESPDRAVYPANEEYFSVRAVPHKTRHTSEKEDRLPSFVELENFIKGSYKHRTERETL